MSGNWGWGRRGGGFEQVGVRTSSMLIPRAKTANAGKDVETFISVGGKGWERVGRWVVLFGLAAWMGSGLPVLERWRGIE